MYCVYFASAILRGTKITVVSFYTYQEGHAVRAEVGVHGDDAEHEGDGEGLHGAVCRVAEPQRGRVESMAFEVGRAVG